MADDESLQTKMSKLMADGQWEEARDVVYRLLSMQPESSWIHCNMGSILYNLWDCKNAEIHLKMAIAQDPNYSDAYNYLAHVYMRMGRMGTADDCNKTALTLEPNDQSNLELAIHLALFYDDLPQAEHHLRSLERVIPEGAVLTSQRTAVLSHPKSKNKLDAAKQIEAQEKALTQDPDHTDAHAELAMLHLKHTKDYKRAEKHITLALTKEPANKKYHLLYTDIIRKKNPLMRILSWPFGLFGSEDREDNHYIIIIFVMLVIALIGSTLPPHLMPVLAVFVSLLVGLFLILYPIIKLYEYLTITDYFHKTNQVHLFKGPLRKIHRLSYSSRVSIFSLLLLSIWAILFSRSW